MDGMKRIKKIAGAKVKITYVQGDDVIKILGTFMGVQQPYDDTHMFLLVKQDDDNDIFINNDFVVSIEILDAEYLSEDELNQMHGHGTDIYR
jgi:hypothetical protein